MKKANRKYLQNDADTTMEVSFHENTIQVHIEGRHNREVDSTIVLSAAEKILLEVFCEDEFLS